MRQTLDQMDHETMKSLKHECNKALEQKTIQQVTSHVPQISKNGMMQTKMIRCPNELGFHIKDQCTNQPTNVRHTRSGFQKHIFNQSLRMLLNQVFDIYDPELGFRSQDETQETTMKPHHQNHQPIRVCTS